ncbi:MAG: NAD(P)-dependent alcohol dehydrogenase [Sphingomonadaceae bacterium]|nr:NAD(P)-dependent alcohol dehydrogenase [Sphingomonadaceae bacterium]
MKAVRLRAPGGIDQLEVAELPDPGAPGAGEIVVRLRASSLNYHDYKVVLGDIPTEDGRIPMSDGAGDVIAIGAGVTDFKPGDAALSLFFPNWPDGAPIEGGFSGVPGDGADGYACELVRAPASAFTRVPKGYSHAEAATLTCAGLTAWRALVVEGHLKAGDRVLVQGTGGVSIFALQFAKAMGATVIATSSCDTKLDRLKAMGADHVINYKTTPKWGTAARAWTGGIGVDHVVEVGGAGTLPQSLSAARVGGHISLIGVLEGLEGPIPTALIMRKQVRLIGITVGTRRSQLDMIAAIEANGIRPVIDKHFPLEELGDAFRYQESGRHFGKIAVDI